LKVRYDSAQDILVYERTLSPGAGSTIYGIEVARALGMPQEILDKSVKFRRTLQGETVEEDLSGSSWNSNIVARACEVCGCKITRDLEVHHVRPRVEAAAQAHFDDGDARDSTRNLIVVCAKCHDAHHSGQRQISPALDTSVGVRREISPVSVTTQISPKKEKYSSEQLEIIQKTLQEMNGLPLKMARGKLANTYNITVSEAFLRSKREHD
jgi:cytochrome c553